MPPASRFDLGARRDASSWRRLHPKRSLDDRPLGKSLSNVSACRARLDGLRTSALVMICPVVSSTIDGHLGPAPPFARSSAMSQNQIHRNCCRRGRKRNVVGVAACQIVSRLDLKVTTHDPESGLVGQFDFQAFEAGDVGIPCKEGKGRRSFPVTSRI